jgi:hypothetical protein
MFEAGREQGVVCLNLHSNWANGVISLFVCSGPGSAERQAEALREEGVEVTSDSMGEFYVDLSRYGWFPVELESEDEGDVEDGNGDAGTQSR